MGNLFSTVALVSWPIISLLLYMKRPLPQATMWTVLAAQMLLPVGALIKFQMIPQFDKETIPCLCILVGCMVVARRPLKLLHGRGLADLLIIMSIASPILTSELNGDTITLIDRVLPGVGLYDAISAVEYGTILLIPFFVGRQFFRSPSSSKQIMLVLTVAGLLYSIPLLFEIRFSPQLHYWVYGFYPTDFLQSVRDGGFRPMAFMGHGLLAALYVMMSAVAAATLWRSGTSLFSFRSSVITGYLALLMIVCKSAGATIYTFTLIPLIKWMTPKFQARVAVVLVLVALLYPALSVLKLFPSDAILQLASVFSEDRAQSLQVRFDNEAILLDHALERPIFGWGRYGRNRVYDAESGKDDSITDGQWIIVLGGFGLFGFVAQFGLLAIGVFRAASALKFAESTNEKIFFSALCLIVAVNILDLLPNSGLRPWTWLLAGALLGRAEQLQTFSKRVDRSVGLSMEARPGVFY
jgi:hypothetical protein